MEIQRNLVHWNLNLPENVIMVDSLDLIKDTQEKSLSSALKTWCNIQFKNPVTALEYAKYVKLVTAAGAKQLGCKSYSDYLDRKSIPNLPVPVPSQNQLGPSQIVPKLPAPVPSLVIESTVPTSQFICQMCSRSLAVSYILNCGHLPFCDECSSLFIYDRKKCPICNTCVISRQRAYLELMKTRDQEK